MVRAPCCEKMGLKKGPWTIEEDRILISFIQKHGHENWRALPKQAGLLRCGKSCRLRWINYLKPDIKRGNFTKEEEETIINLHELLGNRWSAIARRLPGRTDNEIKNVWHTHLKKRIQKRKEANLNPNSVTSLSIDSSTSTMSPHPSSSSEQSSAEYNIVKDEQNENSSLENFLDIDESFWSDALSGDVNSSMQSSEFEGVNINELQYDQSPFDQMVDDGNNMDFWYNILVTAGDDQSIIF